MEDINKIIGKNLLQLRKNAKLTQMELADIFNYSDKSISKWETGESLPSIETLYDICIFYGVTLDSLTKEDVPAPVEEVKPKRNLLPVHLVITLLAVSAVWLLATVLFVSFKISIHKNIGFFFLWAVPISFVVLLIFNCIWGRKYLLFAILTALIWTTLTCIHVQLLKYNLWMIYLLGIPLQVGVILWGALLKKPRKQKQKPEQVKETKKAEIKQKREQKKNKKDVKFSPEIVPITNVEPMNDNSAEPQTLQEEKIDTLQKMVDTPQQELDNNLQQETASTSQRKNKNGKKDTSQQDDDFGYDFIEENKDKKS